MIISRTPMRISFLGGGTDYPDYYNRAKGAVVGTTIDKYSYIAVYYLSDFFDYKIKVTYSKIEIAHSLDEIEHPSVRECLRFMGIDSNIEIEYLADLPARTGLGTSSAFTVGLLNALYAFRGQMVTKERLAEEAIHVEQNLISERVGSQDQYHAAFGGLNTIRFNREGIKINPLIIAPDVEKELEASIMMFYTGIRRHAHEILKEQMEKTKKKQNDEYLEELYDLVEEGCNVLTNDGSIQKFGEVMHEGWELKKRLSDAVTNKQIDAAYEQARAAGAWGGKLAGAGGGGFLILVVPKEKQDNVRNALKPLKEVNFKFEKEGSTIIYYRPNGPISVEA